jgi:hypothetical protein
MAAVELLVTEIALPKTTIESKLGCRVVNHILSSPFDILIGDSSIRITGSDGVKNALAGCMRSIGAVARLEMLRQSTGGDAVDPAKPASGQNTTLRDSRRCKVL